MVHIISHFLVPLIVAWFFYRSKWKLAFLILIATMVVDADHLLANPVYDPNRCSIGFHPLHTIWAIAVYILMFTIPFYLKSGKLSEAGEKWNFRIQLTGLGLLIHMLLDGLDCFI
ncbi:DUF6122 family protein [Gracilimonas sediminicola]|uniref:DUF6122 family protein n=1 Tax=Gracilimonas sediminicola TaxID=2952158 RepID=A0A9X2L5S2_9BACT|nr:DUF6122 family protein [Gracilimonas sediminicola]MCP9292905.1 DUF6122 family protein [Gracilimonas sediminicola]